MELEEIKKWKPRGSGLVWPSCQEVGQAVCGKWVEDADQFQNIKHREFFYILWRFDLSLY